MKNKMLALLVLAALVLSLLVGCGAPEYIGEDRAKQIAIGDTYYSAADVRNISAELTEEEESAYYTVSFTVEGMDYVYKLDAVSGEILEYPTII